MGVNVRNLDHKYIVLKVDDVHKTKGWEQDYLSDAMDAVNRVREEAGKKPNEYVVVNMDEPYADEVLDVLRKHGVLSPKEAEELPPMTHFPISRSKCDEHHPTCYQPTYPTWMSHSKLCYAGDGEVECIEGEFVADAHNSAFIGQIWLSETMDYFHYIDAQRKHRRIPTIIIDPEDM